MLNATSGNIKLGYPIPKQQPSTPWTCRSKNDRAGETRRNRPPLVPAAHLQTQLTTRRPCGSCLGPAQQHALATRQRCQQPRRLARRRERFGTRPSRCFRPRPRLGARSANHTIRSDQRIALERQSATPGDMSQANPSLRAPVRSPIPDAPIHTAPLRRRRAVRSPMA